MGGVGPPVLQGLQLEPAEGLQPLAPPVPQLEQLEGLQPVAQPMTQLERRQPVAPPRRQPVAPMTPWADQVSTQISKRK